MKKRVFFTGFLCLLAFSVYAGRPTVHASNITSNNINCTSLKINWNTGNGTSRVIFAREGALPDYSPSDGTPYVANSIFGSSTEYGTKCYVVYNSTGNNFVTITNLKPGKTYYFVIYEHDGAGSFLYYVTGAPTINVTTYDINLDFKVKVIDSCEMTNSFEFTNTSTSTIPGITYYFDFGNGTSTQSPVVHKMTGAGFKSVFIYPVTSLTGCPTSFVKNVKIFQKKIGFFDTKLFEDTQCLETNYFDIQVSPIPSSTSANSGYIYRWWFGNGDSSTFNRMKYKYKKSGTYNVQLEISINSYFMPTPCKDTLYLDLTVLPSPVGNVILKDTFQCLQHNGYVFNNPDNSLKEFKWYFGDNDSSDSQLAIHRYKDTGKYRVMHVAYANTGCKGRDTIDIEVLPDLNSDFLGLDTFYCQSKTPVILIPMNQNGTYYGYPMIGDSMIPQILGNHTLTYIVKDKYCSDTSSAKFRVAATPTPNIGKDTAVCSSFSFDLSANTAGTYYWNTGETTSQITVNKTGVYDVDVTIGKCSASDTISIIFSSLPKINIGRDTILCKGGGLWLKAAYPKSTFLWNTGSKDSSIYVYNPGKYKVTVTNPCGTAQDSIMVFYQSDYCDLFMANAFSPGNDLLNGIFKPEGIDITVKLFQIYNRWGEMVFETDQNDVGWDGTYRGDFAPEGLYIWKLFYTTENGPYIKKNNAFGQVILIK